MRAHPGDTSPPLRELESRADDCEALSNAAVLAVDLGKYRRGCDSPVIGRVRAVLSWGDPSLDHGRECLALLG